MKNLFTYLKTLWSWVADSQGNDVGYDCRLTVVRPSSDCRSTMLKLCSFLAILLTVGVSNVWGGDVTFTREDFTNTDGTNSATKSNVTISCVGNIPNKKSYITFTEGNNLTISTTSGNITAIDFTCVSDDYTGNLSDVSGISTSSWSLSVDNPGAKTTVQVTSIVVTVSAGSTYSITYADAGGSGTNGSYYASSTSGISSGSTITLTATPADCYQLDEWSVYKTGDASTTVTVTNNQFTMPAYNVTVGASFEEKAAGKRVNFDAGPGSCGTSSLTETCDGSGVTLPAVTATGVCKGWTTFAGWATSAVSDSTTTSVTVYSAGSKYTPASNNMTLYAVYSKVKSGGISTASSDNISSESTSAITLETGKPITYKCSSSNSYSDPARIYKGNTLTIAGGTITAISLTGVEDYAVSNMTVNTGTLTTDGDDGSWSGSATSVVFTASSAQTRISAISVSYTGGSTTYYCSDPNCCTELASINGSFSGSTKNSVTVSWTLPEDANEDLKAAGVQLHLYEDNNGEPGDELDNTDDDYETDVSTTTHTFTGLSSDTKYWVTIEMYGATTAHSITYCDSGEGSAVEVRTDPDCSSKYSFHYGTDGGSAPWTVECFEQVSTTHEWKIENFTIPSTPDLYVGKENVFKNGSNGYLNSPENAVSNTVAWADAPTYSSSLWQGQIHLVPYNTSSNDIENWGVGLATGATGTINIYDNSSNKNLFVGFEPDGYGIVYGGNSYAFEETATADVWETDVVTLPASLSTTYYIGLETATEGTYVKCAHSETTDQALSTMGHTSKEGGLRKIWCYSTADNWIGSNAKMAIWDGTNEHWGNNTSDTKFMTKVNDNLWYGYVPTNATTLTLARVNPSSDDPNWDWGKSYDITPSDVNNYITITGTWSNNKAEYTLSSYHPSASASGKFRMWDNNSLKNWCTHWVPYYKLTYNANGGSNAPAATYGNSEITNNVTINNGSGLTAPEGKHFVKWNTASGGAGDDVAAGSYTLTEDLEIFAIYEWNDYTVTVNQSPSVGATLSGGTTTAHYGGTINISTDEPDGYSFSGWTTSDGVTFADASSTSTSFTMPTKNVTVTANFKKIHTVTWHVNGSSYSTGVDDGNTYVVDDEKIDDVPTAPADNTLNNCANKFMGWSTKNYGSTSGKDDSDYDDLFTDVAGSPEISGNTDFYAVFAEEGGSGTYSDGTTHAWTGSGGYTDWGGSTTHSWTRNKCGTIPTHEYTPAYGVKKVVLNVKQTQDKTEASNTVAVTVGGTAIGSTQTMGKGSGTDYYNLTFDNGSGTPLTGKVRIVVTNTSTDPECNTTGLGSFDLNGITLYEGVQDIGYTNYVTQCDDDQVRVTYDFNGGTGDDCTEGVTTKTASYTICSTEPTKDYYDFAGWDDGSGADPYAAGATYNLQATTEFTAAWTATEYSITYNLNGGTQQVTPAAPTSYTYESSAVTLPTAPTKGHDRFDGWYANSGLTGDVQTTIAAGSNGNKEYWAKWTARNEFKFYKDDELLATLYRAADENLESAASGTLSGQGAKPSDPSAPTDCSSKVFMGWTETWFNEETDTEPADLSDATGQKAAGKTYYAVWATRSGDPGSYTYSAYSTTCCSKQVTLSDGSPSNGTVTFDYDYVWTCKGSREVEMTITPSSGYYLSAWSSSGVTPTSVDPAISYGSVSDDGAQVSTVTFAQNTTAGTYTASATFTAKPLTGWSWKYKKDADITDGTVDPYDIPEVVEIYKNQRARFIITGYAPSDIIDAKKGYVYSAGGVEPAYDPTCLSWVANTTSYFTLYGLTTTESTTITFKAVGDNTITKTMTIRVTALPTVKFEDLIHNKDDFANSGDGWTAGTGVLSSTAALGVVNHAKKTPTHADVPNPSSASSCENTHLHLVGWIRSDWPTLVAYMNGTGSAPDTDAITGAGTDGDSKYYFFLPDASINTETYNGFKFYAVWAVEE